MGLAKREFTEYQMKEIEEFSNKIATDLIDPARVYLFIAEKCRNKKATLSKPTRLGEKGLWVIGYKGIGSNNQIKVKGVCVAGYYTPNGVYRNYVYLILTEDDKLKRAFYRWEESEWR